MCQVESGNPNINLDFATIASFLGERWTRLTLRNQWNNWWNDPLFHPIWWSISKANVPVICFGIMKCYSVEGGVFSPQAHRISRKNWRAVDEVKWNVLSLQVDWIRHLYYHPANMKWDTTGGPWLVQQASASQKPLTGRSLLNTPNIMSNVETLWQLTHLLKTKKINTNIMAGQPTPPLTYPPSRNEALIAGLKGNQWLISHKQSHQPAPQWSPGQLLPVLQQQNQSLGDGPKKRFPDF